MKHHSALKPLGELLETYSQCLCLSQNFVDCKIKTENEASADAWEDFLNARADLFDFAETSLHDLKHNCLAPDDDPEAEERQELTDKILSVLGEMGSMEDRLAAFLGESLDSLKATILAMQKSQPIFKRYAQAPSSRGASPRLISHTL